jgi:predicted Rossmann-fold nucleotide-binding protein
LGRHDKPIVFLNTRNFFKPLFGQFETLLAEGFTPLKCEPLYHATNRPDQAVEMLCTAAASAHKKSTIGQLSPD